MLDVFENFLSQESLPGEKAQLRMAPQFRSLMNIRPGPKTKQSAVLIALKERHEELVFPVIRRTMLGVHGGQVSLPGGYYDEKCDQDFYQTALRECSEELGVKHQLLRYLGKLTPLYIPVSDSMVHPFIASLNSNAVLNLNAKEVADIYWVPALSLFENKDHDYVDLKPGMRMQVPMYKVGPAHIWGATAMILSEFDELLQPFKR